MVKETKADAIKRAEALARSAGFAEGIAYAEARLVQQAGFEFTLEPVGYQTRVRDEFGEIGDWKFRANSDALSYALHINCEIRLAYTLSMAHHLDAKRLVELQTRAVQQIGEELMQRSTGHPRGNKASIVGFRVVDRAGQEHSFWIADGYSFAWRQASETGHDAAQFLDVFKSCLEEIDYPDSISEHSIPQGAFATFPFPRLVEMVIRD